MDTSAPLRDVSPDGLTEKLESYRGVMIDLDRQQVVSSEMLIDGWRMLSRRIGENGLHPGDRVLVAVSNGPLYVAVWGAILEREGTPIPVHFETPLPEIHRMARHYRAAFVVTDYHGEPELESIEAEAYTLECSSWDRIVWAQLFDQGRAIGDTMQCNLAGVPLHPTSGTTGQPKLAIRPIRTALAEVEHYVETFGIDDKDTILGMTPMSHAYAHGFCAIAPLVTGASLLTMRRFQPKLVVKGCREFDVTILPAVAGILDTMLFFSGDALHRTQRKVFTGGGPLRERTARQFHKLAGTIPRPLYGSTEAGGIAVGEPGGVAINGRIGKPFQGVSIRMKAGLNAQEDTFSQVQVKSDSVMLGYLVDETIDTSTVDDGWFNTGDLGRMDRDNALYLYGREAEVINVSGMKVLPREVEDVIGTISGVKEVKVYGCRNRSGSYHVRAAVVPDADSTGKVSAEHIRAECQRQLVYYKRPANVVLMQCLPKNSNGKVALEQLP